MSQVVGSLQRQLVTVLEDFKRAQATWEEINSHAFPTANALANAVIQHKYVDEPQYWHPQLTLSLPNLIQAFDQKMEKIVEQHATKLSDLLDKLAKQYDKMKRLDQDLSVLVDQTEKRHGSDMLVQPIFQTWSLTTLTQHIHTITEMYTKELETKRSLLRGLREMQSREEGLVLLSIWTHQPSLSESYLQTWQDSLTTELQSQ
ncbi:hypothetical protein BD560DRAFT_440537 [Blakeslea trispora]|nr:hypothetical protein BD560DRAFT_440537 [Blakeslea trispora]